MARPSIALEPARRLLFVSLWIVISLLTLIGGLMLVGPNLEVWPNLVGPAVGHGLFGAMVGATQACVLLLNFRRVRLMALWIFSTFVGFAADPLVTSVSRTAYSFRGELSRQGAFNAEVTGIFVGGIIIFLLQWLSLRQTVPNAHWWALGNALLITGLLLIFHHILFVFLS